MEEQTKPRLDAGRCTGCGLCLDVCPSDVLALENGSIILSREGCFGCDHCAAVCPTGAITIDSVSTGNLALATVETGGRWLPFGEFDTALLVRLLYSRRSCRCFTEDPVGKAVLEDLARIGTMAPSGTNSQLWSFTIVPDRQALLGFGQLIARFYERLNRLAANPAIRLVSRLFMQDKLGHYYRRYHTQVQEALRQWERDRARQALPRRHGGDPHRDGAGRLVPARGCAACRPEHCPCRPRHGRRDLPHRLCR